MNQACTNNGTMAFHYVKARIIKCTESWKIELPCMEFLLMAHTTEKRRRVEYRAFSWGCRNITEKVLIVADICYHFKPAASWEVVDL